MKKLILISCLLVAAITINAQQSDFPKLTGPYQGQKPPGMELVSVFHDGPAPFLSPDSLEARIDSIFKEWNHPYTPGGVIAIVEDGKVLFMKGYGCADLENPASMSAATKLYLASISKQFTGYCVAKLVIDGKLSLDDDIRKHIPEMSSFQQTVRVRDLVYQKSGLRDMYGLLPLTGSRLNDFFSNEEVLKILCKQHDLNFMPGDEWEYSNTNYFLLAEIVKRITGESVKQWAEKNIFSLLRMMNTCYVDSIETLIPCRAKSYHQNKDGSFSNDPFLDVTTGHTGVYSTAEDMSIWLLHICHLIHKRDPLLTLMLKSDTLNNGQEISNYSFGLFKSSGKSLQYWHRGSLFGFKSIISYYPEKDFGLVIMGNVNTFNRRKYARDVTRIFYPEIAADDPVRADPIIVHDSLARRSIVLNPATLGKFEGHYRVDSMTVYMVNVRHDSLFLNNVRESTTVHLIPVGQNTFRNDERTMLINFSEKKHGIIEEMTYQTASENVVGKKAPMLTSAYARNIIGNYYNDELEIRVTIAQVSAGIEVSNLKLGKFKTYLSSKDEFRCDHDFFSVMKCYRNSKKEIEGVMVDGFTVRKLKFVKLFNDKER